MYCDLEGELHRSLGNLWEHVHMADDVVDGRNTVVLQARTRASRGGQTEHGGRVDDNPGPCFVDNHNLFVHTCRKVARERPLDNLLG